MHFLKFPIKRSRGNNIPCLQFLRARLMLIYRCHNGICPVYMLRSYIFLLSDFNSTKEGRKTLFVIVGSFSLCRIFGCSGLSQEPSVIFSVFSSQGFLNAYRKICSVLIPFEEFVDIGLFGRLVKKLHQVPA